MTANQYFLVREIEKARAKHKPIEIVVPDVAAVEGVHEGYKRTTLKVDLPQLWPDDVSVSAQINPARAARLLIGDDRYSHWSAAGGTAGILFEIIRDATGAELGESSAS